MCSTYVACTVQVVGQSKWHRAMSKKKFIVLQRLVIPDIGPEHGPKDGDLLTRQIACLGKE
jgi:hypothetical protein